MPERQGEVQSAGLPYWPFLRELDKLISVRHFSTVGTVLAANLNALPWPKELAGIEVKSGPRTLPPQYRGFGMTCGLIIVWTRIGG